MALGWGIRRFHNNIYMFSNPAEFGKKRKHLIMTMVGDCGAIAYTRLLPSSSVSPSVHRESSRAISYLSGYRLPGRCDALTVVGVYSEAYKIYEPRPPAAKTGLFSAFLVIIWCDVFYLLTCRFFVVLFLLLVRPCVSCFCVFSVLVFVVAPALLRPAVRPGGTKTGVRSWPWWRTMTNAYTLSLKTWGCFLTSTSSSPAAR